MRTQTPSSLFVKKIRTAFISTMNVSELQMREYYYTLHTALNESLLCRTFGHAESLFAFETLQSRDYNRIVFSYSGPEEGGERRRIVFPQDCKRAFDLGARRGKSR